MTAEIEAEGMELRLTVCNYEVELNTWFEFLSSSVPELDCVKTGVWAGPLLLEI